MRRRSRSRSAASGPTAPTWGTAYKRHARDDSTAPCYGSAHTTSLPVETNNVTLDPTVKDAWGLPAIRVTYKDHPDDLQALRAGSADRGARAARRGRRARTLVVRRSADADRGVAPARHLPHGQRPARLGRRHYHRAHDVPNLFICDGSSLVTSGRGQPTMTIQALAFRAAEGMIRSARRNEIRSGVGASSHISSSATAPRDWMADPADPLDPSDPLSNALGGVAPSRSPAPARRTANHRPPTAVREATRHRRCRSCPIAASPRSCPSPSR